MLTWGYSAYMPTYMFRLCLLDTRDYSSLMTRLNTPIEEVINP